MPNGSLAAATIAVLALLASSTSALQPKTWELNRANPGDWTMVAAAPTTRASNEPDPVLDRVEQLLRYKDNRAAAALGIQWLKRHHQHPQRDRALLLIAQAFYQYGDRVKSYYYLDELMEEHPESSFYGLALDNQYQIADAYLNGYKRRFLGVPMFHATEEAIEMLWRIQQRAPG